MNEPRVVQLIAAQLKGSRAGSSQEPVQTPPTQAAQSWGQSWQWSNSSEHQTGNLVQGKVYESVSIPALSVPCHVTPE